MKLLNKAMIYVVLCQEWLENFENKIIEIEKHIQLEIILDVLFFVTAGVVFWANQQWGLWIGTGIIICRMMLKAIGWRKSVRKWLYLTIVVDGLFIALVYNSIKLPSGYQQCLTVGAVILFFFLWTIFSLLAVSKVSRLVNEIVASASATIFSIGTFVISLLNIDESQVIKYQYIEQNMDAIFQEKLLQYIGDIVIYSIYEFANAFFLCLLPIIGVSAFCVVLCSVKEYWMKKYGIVEAGSTENNTSWINSKLFQYSEISCLFRMDNELIVHRINNKNNLIGASSNNGRNIVIQDFQKSKINMFLDAIKIDGKIEQIQLYDVDIRINVAKTIDMIDKLAIDYKVKYYGNLIRNAYFFCGKMNPEQFEEYFEFLNRVSIKNLKTLKQISEYYHFSCSLSFSLDDIKRYFELKNEDFQLEDALRFILNEEIIQENGERYFILDKFKKIDINILLSYREYIDAINL